MSVPQIDRHSDTWLQVSQYAAGRIRDLKHRCSRVGATHEERLVCAAQVEELERLMGLEKPLIAVGGSTTSEVY